jgi:predicted nucleic acid-binding protein
LRDEVFLDASYAIALSASTDEYHDRAGELAEQIEAEDTRLVTTRAIVLEIGNALARLRYRRAAVELLDALENDPGVEIVPVTERLYERAFRLYRDRPDKEWGLTDCLSFVVMEDRELTDALMADDHFRQAGFRALLRDDRRQNPS